jgi:hypothetical protein
VAAAAGLALLAATAWARAAAAEAVTFTYRPPVGRAFDLTESHAESFELGVTKQQILVRTRTRVEASREGDRIYLRARIEAVEATHDGQPEKEPIARSLEGASFVRTVRPDGSLVAIDGNRAVYEKLAALSTGDQKAEVEATLEAGVIDDLDLYGWRQQVEMLAGQTLELDRDYYFDDAFPTGRDGWVNHQTLFRLGPWENRPEGRLLRVSVAFVPDARAVIPAAVRIEPRVRTKLDLRHLPKLAEGYKLTGNASHLVDPATLTYWQAQVIRKIQQMTRVSDALSVTVTREQRETGVLTAAGPAGRP